MNPVFTKHLTQLEQATRVLAESDRQELLADITEHLNAADVTEVSDVDAYQVVERLGRPEELVAAVEPHIPASDTRKQTSREQTSRDGLTLALMLAAAPLMRIPLFGWILLVVRALIVATSTSWDLVPKICTAVLLLTNFVLFGPIDQVRESLGCSAH